MNLELEGKRVLVTGGSSGLGFAVAQALVDEGARVALNARDTPRLAEASARLGAVAVPADLSTPDGPRRAVEQATRALGGLDGGSRQLRRARSRRFREPGRGDLAVGHRGHAAEHHPAVAARGDRVEVRCRTGDRRHLVVIGPPADSRAHDLERPAPRARRIGEDARGRTGAADPHQRGRARPAEHSATRGLGCEECGALWQLGRRGAGRCRSGNPAGALRPAARARRPRRVPAVGAGVVHHRPDHRRRRRKRPGLTWTSARPRPTSGARAATCGCAPSPTLRMRSARPSSTSKHSTNWRGDPASSAPTRCSPGQGPDAVGAATGKPDPHEEGGREIVGMWVDAAHRRTGVAAALIDELATWAVPRARRQSRSGSRRNNDPARRLYEKCGFVATGERDVMRPGSTRCGCGSRWPESPVGSPTGLARFWLRSSEPAEGAVPEGSGGYALFWPLDFAADDLGDTSGRHAEQPADIANGVAGFD